MITREKEGSPDWNLKSLLDVEAQERDEDEEDTEGELEGSPR
jgi:hypothetical protein